MAKMNRVSLARKRELEEPDVVLSFLQRATVWVSLHRRQILISAGAFLAAVMIIVGGAYYFARTEKVAFDRLAGISPAALDKTTADADKQNKAMEAYRQLNEEYGRTYAGKVAGLKYAEAVYQAGDYEKAITAYREALSDFKGNAFLRALALNGLGYAHEARSEYDQAITCFQQILDDPEAMIKDEPLFHLGRLYALKGDKENSQAMFSRLLKDYPDSSYAKIIREGESG
ncbi:MAG: tetratricopeptide repeat protein [Thermodesulfobacteriota bacterium]